MPRYWYIKSKRGVRGPVSSDTLSDLAREGKLTPRHAVSRDEAKWYRASKVTGLEFPLESQRWFILTRRGKVGPVSLRRLVRLAETARINSRTKISRDGKEWIKAKRHPKLRFFDVDQPRWHVQASGNHDDQDHDSAADSPISLRELAEMARQGGLAPTDRVSLDGRSWMKANRIVGLRFCPPGSLPQKITDDSIAIEKEPFPAKPAELTSGEAEEATGGARESTPTDWMTVDQTPPASWKLPITAAPAIHPMPLAPERSTPVASHASLIQPDVEDPGAVAPLPLQPLLPLPKPVVPEPVKAERETPQTETPQTETSADEPDDSPTRIVALQSTTCQENHPSSELVEWLSDQEHVNDETEAGFSTSAQAPITSPAPCPFAIRESAFVERFGDQWIVHDEPSNPIAETRIYEFSPNSQRQMTTLVTSGMSDHRMSLPPGLNSPRVELMMYVEEMRPEYPRLLRFLSQVPARTGQPIGYGTTIGNGSPPRPIFADSLLDCYLFLVPPIESDFQIQESLRIEDDAIQLLWVTPITSAERRVVNEQGVQAFCALCDQHLDSGVLMPGRHCYATCNVPIQPLDRWEVI